MENPDNSGRDRLVAAIMEAMVGQDLLSAPDVRAELEREVDEAGASRVHHLLAERAHGSAPNSQGHR